MKKIIIVTAVIAAAGLLAGCGQSGGTTTNTAITAAAPTQSAVHTDTVTASTTSLETDQSVPATSAASIGTPVQNDEFGFNVHHVMWAGRRVSIDVWVTNPDRYQPRTFHYGNVRLFDNTGHQFTPVTPRDWSIDQLSTDAFSMVFDVPVGAVIAFIELSSGVTVQLHGRL